MNGPWWRDGLRFECTQCGNCCTGGEGAVWYTPEEAVAMAADLGMPLAQFESQFTRAIGSSRSLNERKTEHGWDCVFLDRQSMPGKALCRIYRSRPSQCRTWPFWEENLRSRKSWDEAKARTPCPGMDRGRLVPPEEIRIHRASDADAGTPW